MTIQTKVSCHNKHCHDREPLLTAFMIIHKSRSVVLPISHGEKYYRNVKQTSIQTNQFQKGIVHLQFTYNLIGLDVITVIFDPDI